MVADLPIQRVPEPVNFAGRDYFQDQRKNPADVLLIGRPFATAPNQHASIPITRRLASAGGAFAGVVVAGVRLTWLDDLLSHEQPRSILPAHRSRSVATDGLVLMRTPFDGDAIGRGGDADPAWQSEPLCRTGAVARHRQTQMGIRLFRRLGATPLDGGNLKWDPSRGIRGRRMRPWLMLAATASCIHSRPLRP